MNDLAKRLKELAKEHDVPGASLAVLTDDGIETAVAGVINRNTRVTTTPDSVFQIGSITKVYTTTLMMQLVDDGVVDLDATVKTYLERFTLRDRDAAEVITVRQLLTHTNGIEGDYFADFGPGADAVERYVDSLSGIGLAHPVGEMWSYSNAALVVAGRIIEVLTGLNYDDALRQKLLEPAGLGEHVSLVGDAILRRAAAGHLHGPKKKRAAAATPWALPRSTGPAGATISASARDVAAFGAIHMNDGRAANGTQILSPASVKQMQTSQFRFAGWPEYQSMGLGWILEDWNGAQARWHNGGTVGQYSFLCIVPERRFAVCVLTNADTGPQLADTLTREIFSDRLGVTRPALPELPKELPSLDLAKYAGTYERLGFRIEIEPDDGKLNVTVHIAPIFDAKETTQKFPVSPMDAARFAIVNGEGKVQRTIFFDGFDETGRPGYVSIGRIAKRVQ